MLYIGSTSASDSSIPPALPPFTAKWHAVGFRWSFLIRQLFEGIVQVTFPSLRVHLLGILLWRECH